MKIYLATWYMEKAWKNIGPLRNIKFMHRLFNKAFGLRRDEYIARIMSFPVKGA